MSSDIEKKKEYLLSLYPGDRWANRVANMSDQQVIAVYLAKKEADAKPKPKKRKVRQDETLF
jgi:hypothetical protein